MVDDGPPLVVPYSGSFGVAEKIRRLDDGLHWLESGTATLKRQAQRVAMPPLRSRSALNDDYRRVGSSLSRSQSPRRLIERVVSTITVAGASMIQGARVMYSRP